MRALAACVLLAVLGSSVVARAPAQPNVAEQRTAEAKASLQKALDDAKAADRVLLVTFNSDAGRAKSNEAVLAVPATAAWIARHGATHAVTDQRLITGLSDLKFFRTDKEGKPVADPSRKLVQTPGGDPLLYTDGLIELLDGKSSILFPGATRSDPKTVAGQGSIVLALRMDWTVRSPMASQDFRKRHEARLAPLGWSGAGSARPPLVLKALGAARSLAREKKWDQAANAYANAWIESCGEPASTPVRLGTMAGEMALVAQQSAGAKDRLLGLRTEYARAMNVSDPRQVHEYLILCRVVGDHEHNFKFLDEVTQGKSALTSVPAADLLAYDWMMPRCHWNDPTEGVPSPQAWVVQLIKQCDKRAARKDAGELAGAVDYGRWLARLEGARRLEWLLAAGKEEQAAALRDAVLAADGSPEMRRAMVAACVGAEQKRPWMAETIKGIDDAALQGELAK